jgi:hypothetical protein
MSKKEEDSIEHRRLEKQTEIKNPIKVPTNNMER